MDNLYLPNMQYLIPLDARHALLRRGLIVGAVNLVIAALQTLLAGRGLASSLVYSLAIGTSIWVCVDVMRVVLHRVLQSSGPHYWAWTWRMAVFVALGVVLGYSVGTWVGDAYTGKSTLALLTQAPEQLLGLLLFSLVVSVGFVVFFYLREYNAELKRQAADAQLRLLQSQLEPHMLFNTLANLRALVSSDTQQALLMLDKLNRYLRTTLSASRTLMHPLSEEMAQLQDYLDIMTLRMGERLSYRIDLPESLASFPVPPLLLQPLVENAIRHGLEPHLGLGQLTISAQDRIHTVVLTVSDNGVGVAEQLKTPSGFGLWNVKQRLLTQYGEKARFEWHAAETGGLSVHLHIPKPPPFS